MEPVKSLYGVYSIGAVRLWRDYEENEVSVDARSYRVPPYRVPVPAGRFDCPPLEEVRTIASSPRPLAGTRTRRHPALEQWRPGLPCIV